MSNKGKDDKPDEKRAYRINEAVATYRLSRSTLYKLIAAGKLRSIKIGGRRTRSARFARITVDGGNNMNASRNQVGGRL